MDAAAIKCDNWKSSSSRISCLIIKTIIKKKKTHEVRDAFFGILFYWVIEWNRLIAGGFGLANFLKSIQGYGAAAGGLW